MMLNSYRVTVVFLTDGIALTLLWKVVVFGLGCHMTEPFCIPCDSALRKLLSFIIVTCQMYERKCLVFVIFAGIRGTQHAYTFQ
jgi:hypothetical protein